MPNVRAQAFEVQPGNVGAQVMSVSPDVNQDWRRTGDLEAKKTLLFRLDGRAKMVTAPPPRDKYSSSLNC